MTAKKYDYIIIYCFLFASILCIAVLARLFVVRELQMDEFSGLAAFVVVCLLLSATYLSFQSFVNEWLQPIFERILREKHPHIEPELEVEPFVEALQEKSSVPNYEEYKLTAQQKIQQKQAQTLENVLTYAGKELSLYMTESELQQLYEHIRFFQFATEKECGQINTPVTVDAKLKSIDLMHFGWNIGNVFGKTRLQTATFIKRVFPHTLHDSVISTLERKMSHTESKCRIKLERKIV